jgi:hypothetical protein
MIIKVSRLFKKAECTLHGLPVLKSRPYRIRIDFSSSIRASRHEAGVGPAAAVGIINMKTGYIQRQNA